MNNKNEQTMKHVQNRYLRVYASATCTFFLELKAKYARFYEHFAQLPLKLYFVGNTHRLFGETVNSFKSVYA